ncbi:MAG: ATP-binding cassette domain-containing protein [Ruminococcus sp.]|nr:ATP-binding cassette domain-containing protein [Ruminococcus sp.]
MALFKIKNLSFKYASEETLALKDISFETQKGEVIAVIGSSGSGKTTLLRSLKKSIAPKGELSGEVKFFGGDEIKDIGFVFQNPYDQSVCQTVFEELVFAPQNLGLAPDIIRVRVAEVCAFFGIGDLVSKKMSELSGGEVQTVNLAAAAVLSPSVILLDEPTAQLDPISSQRFTQSLGKLKDEMATSIIVSTHSIENLLPFVDKILVLEDGRLSFFGEADEVINLLKESKNPLALVGGGLPLISKSHVLKTVKQARDFLYSNDVSFAEKPKLQSDFGETMINAKGIYMRYEKYSKDVLCDVSLKVNKGEVSGLCGTNGSGKTTLLCVLSKSLSPYSGRVKLGGDPLYIPQDPRMAFVKDSIYEDIKFLCELSSIPLSELDRVKNQYSFFKGIDKILGKHPYDLSGGELQKAVVLKALVADKDILLFDEPVKGLDPKAKEEFRKMILEIKPEKAIIIASHDIEFLADSCDDIAMLFGGEIVSRKQSDEFVCENSYFTTSLSRATKGIKDGIITSRQLWGEI